MTEADNAAPVQTDNAAPDTASRMDMGEQPVETTETPAANDFKIPDAYKEKGWTKNVKSVEDLFKIHDDAQALIGKKKIVPDWDNATEQEIESYLDQLRPKDGYDALFAEDVPAERKEALSGLLKNSGLSKVQAERLVKGYMEMEQSVTQKMFDKDDFVNILKESFGESYQQEAGQTAALIKKNLSDADKAALDEVPNKYLGLIYRLANNLRNAYGADETGIMGDRGRISPADIDKQITELKGQMRELTSRPHNSADKQAIQDQLDKLYDIKVKRQK